MVLNLPEVSKSIIRSEQELTAQDHTIAYAISENNNTNLTNINKHNFTQLSYFLQLSLETDKILQLFFKQIKPLFNLSKLQYINKHNGHNINILLGNKISSAKLNLKCTKKYELFYQQEYLGDINFSSKIKLNPSRSVELRSYLNLLILPLRNSLLYTKALKDTRKDQLTQTGNRLALLEDLNYHFNFSIRYNSPLSIIFIDIDFFKRINDQYGHILGDKILISFADLLKNIIRKSDMIYRFGGEEFVILLDNTNQKGALNLAKKIKKHINNNKLNNLVITVSMGVATKNAGDNTETLIERADKALYLAKSNGRDRFEAG